MALFVLVALVIVARAIIDPSEGLPLLIFFVGYAALSAWLARRVHLSRRAGAVEGADD